MNYHPICAYVGFILAYSLSEWLVVLKNKSLRRWKDPSVPLFAVLIKAVMILPFLEYVYFQRTAMAWAHLVGGVAFVSATILRVKGHLDLKRGFTPNVEKLGDQELVDKGIYRYIRHPLYLAIICLSFACPVFLCAYYSSIASFMTFVYILKRIRQEEEHLCENMSGYSDYIKRTKALLPGVY